MRITKFGWVRLIVGIFLLLGIARFIYMFGLGGNNSTEWYIAGWITFLLLVDVAWSLVALHRPYFSTVVQTIFLAMLYLGFSLAGGVTTVLIPFLALSTLWCAADFVRFKSRENVQLNALNIIMSVAGLASIAFLLSVMWWLDSTGKSPVG